MKKRALRLPVDYEECLDGILAERVLKEVESGKMSVRPFAEWEKEFDAKHKAKDIEEPSA